MLKLNVFDWSGFFVECCICWTWYHKWGHGLAISMMYMYCVDVDFKSIHIFGTCRKSTKTYGLLDCNCCQNLKFCMQGPWYFAFWHGSMVFIIVFVVKEKIFFYLLMFCYSFFDRSILFPLWNVFLGLGKQKACCHEAPCDFHFSTTMVVKRLIAAEVLQR